MPAKKEIEYRVDQKTGCFICTSHAPNGAGYPLVRENGKRDGAHRIVYRRNKGAIIHGVIRHTCDNTMCVNPEHLIDGTDLDNVLDKEDKGRGNHPARLSKDQILAIRANTSSLHREIAAVYGVSRVHITCIKNYKHWRKV